MLICWCLLFQLVSVLVVLFLLLYLSLSLLFLKIVNDDPMQTSAKGGIVKPKIRLACTSLPLTPSSYKQVVMDLDWLQFMQLEYEALVNNGTWILVPHPPNQKVIGFIWVYRVKEKQWHFGQVKSKLVAQGFTQAHGVDYFDTFSPVKKPVTIRTVLHLALSCDWPLKQLDVNNAFLNGIFGKNVYMQRIKVFVDSQRSHYVCKLVKAL